MTEFAIVSTLLVVLLAAGVDLSLGISKRSTLDNAARAGTQYAAANGWHPDGIIGAVKSATNTNMTVSVNPSKFCGCASDAGIEQTLCSSQCANGLDAAPYARISVKGKYSAIFLSTKDLEKMEYELVTRMPAS